MHSQIGVICWYVLLSLIGGITASAQQTNRAEKTKPAFIFKVNDSLTVNLDLEYNENGYPISYVTDLATDVCSDDLCKPIHLVIRWDLLGHFLSYDATEHKLTKFDHIAFTEEDHIQLNQILSDTASLLRDYEVEDMVDTMVYLPSQTVDAVTRPTSLTFNGTTVEGALYTVYTIWHFVNGPIRSQMKMHTQSLLSDSFLKQMMTSGNRDYVSFVFKHMTKKQTYRLTNDIINLVKSKDRYIPHFALAQLADSITSVPAYQHQLLAYFPHVDQSVKNVLINRLAGVELDGTSLSMLISSLSDLREDQIIKVFSLIEKNKNKINEKIQENLINLTYQEDIIAKQAKIILTRINRLPEKH